MTHNAASKAITFLYESLPTRVIFDSGTRDKVEQEAKRLGMSRILLLCDPPHEDVTALTAKDLRDIRSTAFHGARVHTPVSVTEEAVALVRTSQIDGIVSIGRDGVAPQALPYTRGNIRPSPCRNPRGVVAPFPGLQQPSNTGSDAAFISHTWH